MKSSHFSLAGPARKLVNARGFTMIEVLLAMAVVATIGSLMISQVTGTKDTVDVSKLTSDVQALNSSLSMYQTFGGSLSGAADADAVIAKLKSQRSETSANTAPGLTGSFLDPRITAVWQTAAEAATSQARAVWNGTSFVVATSGAAGIKEFILDGALSAVAPATETRPDFMTASDRTSGARWVWDYVEVAAVSSPAGPPDYTALPESYGASVANEFTGGTVTVDPYGDGSVGVSYVFREAGYNSRLALFSLEGMGSDVYDLDTTAGQNGFLQEALRRVVAGDRAQIIIDASTTSVGFNQTYMFRPGDTLAAILIPNTDFQTALTQFTDFANGTGSSPSSQTYPLTSLSRGDGSTAPFYANQYKTLGNGTNAYAIEDISTLGNSDNDYQDLIFKAVGLNQAEGAFQNNIADPVAFFRNDPYWVTGPGGTPGLHAKLIEAGIIPANTPL